jgi:hypothetical protein
MTIPFAAHAIVPAGVLMQELDGESVFLNLANECYYGLDEVGTRMWKVLTGSESIESAYRELRNEYDVEAAVLRQDLIRLVGELQKHGLVELEGG